jgi:SNF2 family DNA or RNA helicase
MTIISRFSSLRQRLDHAFLTAKLKGAKSYKRIADRVEIQFKDLKPEEFPAAALVESPIYRGGEQLQSWQRSFVTMFLKHCETYGKARLLLADEVGFGKTLSLAASSMLSALLDDGPVLILCPSTLTRTAGNFARGSFRGRMSSRSSLSRGNVPAGQRVYLGATLQYSSISGYA